jgi:hypothetical protein
MAARLVLLAVDSLTLIVSFPHFRFGCITVILSNRVSTSMPVSARTSITGWQYCLASSTD